ncbi:MAG: polysaccharide biosynthesis protein, partial [Eubacteriales bacterium]|nr:polysaccharide biosynthesis protein [Eubacteriales bacterium]
MKNTIIKGPIILTIANVITRILGFVYRVYMSNIIGAEGMGLYQLIMPVYMLVWSLSSSGFSTTISKLVAEENSKKEFGNIKRILNLSIFTSTLIAIFLSIFIFLFSDYIAINIFKDERILLSLHIMCISFPFMAYGSCIRGYFLGMQNALVPAISQVLEQITRMISIYFLASIFIPMGLPYACAVAVIGMCIGEIFSFLYVYLIYNNHIKKSNKKPTFSRFKCYSVILAMAVPLTANRVISSFLTTIENILIPQKLMEYGHSNLEAMSIFGQLSGMSMPLLMFPSSLLTALAISIVPAISDAMARKNVHIIKETISKTFLFTSIISLGTMGIFLIFPYELGIAIYSQEDIGSQLLALGFLCPFLYCHVTLSGILNGLGEQILIFKNSLLSSAINISFISFLIPVYGINAFIIGWLLSLIVINCISLLKLKKRTNFKINLINSVGKPLVCIMASGIL